LKNIIGIRYAMQYLRMDHICECVFCIPRFTHFFFSKAKTEIASVYFVSQDPHFFFLKSQNRNWNLLKFQKEIIDVDNEVSYVFLEPSTLPAADVLDTRPLRRSCTRRPSSRHMIPSIAPPPTEHYHCISTRSCSNAASLETDG
jgi:hypothetical protein